MENEKEIGSYPNQSAVTVHKPVYTGNFLQVGIDEWQQAFANLPRISFGLYLYLCGNMNEYNFWLSSAAVQKALNVSDSSYRRAIEDLLGAGYLKMRRGNKRRLDFFTTPQPTDYVKKVYKRKVKDGGAAAAASVSIDKYATEPQFHEEEPLDEPFSFTLPSGYGWEDN